MADFATIAAKKCIRTLTYDKRGIGESRGVARAASSLAES
jgi:predicted alpha/beta hydrolase